MAEAYCGEGQSTRTKFLDYVQKLGRLESMLPLMLCTCGGSPECRHVSLTGAVALGVLYFLVLAVLAP